MKTSHLILAVCFILSGQFIAAQDTKVVQQSDSTGLPGDNFSLQGALSLFKESKTLEDFEKKLNSDDNYVNNIDLDEDGKTDYILVSDNKEKDSHAIVLQVAVSENEIQDIAVIEIEKTGEKSADLQIVGDENIYGEKKIIEPFDESGSMDKKGPAAPSINLVVVNVWFWPCVSFIYAPTYVVWKSPWHWHHYPSYWKPWKPRPWHIHHTHCKPYYAHFKHTPKHRVVVAHQVYLPHRKESAMVVHRTKPAIHRHRQATPTNSVKPHRVTQHKTNQVRTNSSKGTRGGNAVKSNSKGVKQNSSGHRK